MVSDAPWVVGQKLYRLDDEVVPHWGRDYNGEIYISKSYSVNCKMREYTVKKITPKGAWIIEENPRFHSGQQWVSFKTKKVQVSEQDAIKAAHYRRSYHIEMIKKRLREAERRLAEIESLIKKDNSKPVFPVDLSEQKDFDFGW